MNALPVPEMAIGRTQMRVQEVMYGHRFVNDQEPYMIVLEALAVMADKPLGTVRPSEMEHEAFQYRIPHRRKLRFLLFQDRNLEKVWMDSEIRDVDKWRIWKERVNIQWEDSVNMQPPPNGGIVDHFRYLNQPFENSLRQLRQYVRTLQAVELDALNKRRWTSRFLAVTGPDMICADVRAQGGNWSMDRRFFGRGGELVYLMLNRSPLADELRELVHGCFLNRDDPLNRMAKALSDPFEDSDSKTQMGYLPYIRHRTYEQLAQDWRAILRLERLPKSHKFEPLVRITALNLTVFLAQLTQDHIKGNNIGESHGMPLVMDFANGSDMLVRNCSKAIFNRQRKKAQIAVRKFVKRRANDSAEWKTAVELGHPKSANLALERLFAFKNEDSLRSPESQLETLIKIATERKRNNMSNFLLPLTRNAGLVLAKPGIGTWLAMSDKGIIALVMTVGVHPMELRDFVARLYKRYGIVAGPAEARKAFDQLPINIKRFETNLAALEERMSRLSLTRRLSDDCAFISNPYTSAQHE
ncbi:MAG: hypothetical protein OXB95_13495 [Rhodobacteraceae bacterium]|nr:hypothetical protein [Paracoccaceae bacterium]